MTDYELADINPENYRMIAAELKRSYNEIKKEAYDNGYKYCKYYKLFLWNTYYSAYKSYNHSQYESNCEETKQINERR